MIAIFSKATLISFSDDAIKVENVLYKTSNTIDK